MKNKSGKMWTKENSKRMKNKIRKKVDQRKKGGSPDENDIHDYDNAVKNCGKQFQKWMKTRDED